MRLLYYIKTKPLNKDFTLYGFSCVLNDKTFETICGILDENNEVNANETITKMIFKRNAKNAVKTDILFKYDSPELAKHMNYQFEHNDEYDKLMRETKIDASTSPAIFSSDKDETVRLMKVMDKHWKEYCLYCKKPLDKSFNR